MRKSRRGRIINLIRDGRTDSEILNILDKEFPPGTFTTSNIQAISGTKWDLGISSKERLSTKRKGQLNNTIDRKGLIEKLKEFDASLVVERYRKRDLSGKSPSEILAFSVDKTIYRSFPHETPSLRYRRWRWYKAPEEIIKNLNKIKSQDEFDGFMLSLAESIVEDWGDLNERGKPTRMNIGISLKITNLVLKHLSFSSHNQNPFLIEYLHVPWDRFTLRPLRNVWKYSPAIQKSSSQGFVKDLETYYRLHSLVTDIVNEVGIHRIHYELFAWNLAHQNKSL